MTYNHIITNIDAEISRLQEARKLLASTTDVIATLPSSGRGRPKGSTNKPAKPVPARRVTSAETRARMAEAHQKRHAANKKAAKKTAKEEAARAQAIEAGV